MNESDNESREEGEHMFPHAIKVPIEVVPTGNAAAVREALLTLRDAARNFCHQILNSKYNDIMDEYKCRERGFPALLDMRYAISKANFALVAPPRNCDAGTPEEQTQRMHAQLCSKQKSCYELPSGEHCPMYREGIDCRLAWAQMPYRAEEGGADHA